MRELLQFIFDGLRNLQIHIVEGRKLDLTEEISGRQLIGSRQPRRAPLQIAHQPMYPKLQVYLAQEMHIMAKGELPNHARA